MVSMLFLTLLRCLSFLRALDLRCILLLRGSVPTLLLIPAVSCRPFCSRVYVSVLLTHIQFTRILAFVLYITEQNLCGEFRHMKTPQRTPHVVVIQDVVKMT